MNSEIILGIFSLLLPMAELSPNLMDLPTPQLSICLPTSGLSHAVPLPRNLLPPSSSGYLDLRSRDHFLREAVLTSLLRSSLPLPLGLQRPCYCCSFTSVGTVMWWPCLHWSWKLLESSLYLCTVARFTPTVVPITQLCAIQVFV